MRNQIRHRIAISLLVLAGVGLTALNATGQTVEEADRLFSSGADLNRDQQALGIITKAITSDPQNYQWLWRAARGHYFLGEIAKGQARVKNFESGIYYAQRATAVAATAVEGHFWLGANYGRYSQEKGPFKALSTAKKMRTEMETVLRLDAAYADGSAYLALGELDRQLPRLLGGNLTRAIQRLEQGCKAVPRNLEMKYVLAQAYQEAGRKDDAKRLLNETINGQARNYRDRTIQEKARAHLAKH